MSYYLNPVDKQFKEEEEFKIPAIPLDIPLIMAERQARKIHGKGIVVDSKDPKIVEYLTEFMRVNRIHEQFISFEEIISNWGQGVSCLEPILPGEKVPRWTYADPCLISSVQNMYITETSAVVYKYIPKDTKTWPVLEIWTKDIVKRMYFRDMSKIDTGYGVQYRLPELERRADTVEEVKHNLGCMPIDEVRNKQGYVLPLLDIWNWKPTLATWYPVRGLIKIA